MDYRRRDEVHKKMHEENTKTQLEIAKSEEYQIRNHSKMVDRRELRWLGHLIRIKSNRKPRQVWETRVEGIWGRGRPQIEWEKHTQKLTRKKGRTCMKQLGWRRTEKSSTNG